MHPCGETDLEKFYEPEQSSAGWVKKYTDAGGFMCMDWSAIELLATPYKSNFKAMDVQFLPCGTRETLIGAKEDKIPDDCNSDQQKLFDYLGPLELLVWKNTGRF